MSSAVKEFCYTETENWVWVVVDDELVQIGTELSFWPRLDEENCRDYIFVLVEETKTTRIRRRFL